MLRKHGRATGIVVALSVIATTFAPQYVDGAEARAQVPFAVEASQRTLEFDLPNPASLPTDIVAGAAGSVWISLLGEKLVLHIDSAGSILASVPVSAPVTKMTADRGGGVWGVEYTGNRIVHVGTDDRAAEYPLPGTNRFPSDIWDGGDEVYFAESGAVGRLTKWSEAIDELPLPGSMSPQSLDGNDSFIAVTDAAAGKIWTIARSGTVASPCPIGDAQNLEVAQAPSPVLRLTVQKSNSIETMSCDTRDGTMETSDVISAPGVAAFTSIGNRTFFVSRSSDSLGWSGDPSGRQIVLPSARGDATGLTVTAGRYLWTTEKREGKVVRLDALAIATVERISGSDRYATSAAVPTSAASDTVFIASGETFPDALSASPVAGITHSRLLLTERDSLPGTVRDSLRAMAMKLRRVVVVGGLNSVAEDVVLAIRSALPSVQIERVAGVDRYAVSRALLAGPDYPLGAATLYLADGRNYPDALSASAASGRNSAGLLLVDGSRNALSAEETDIVSRYRGAGKVVKIVGGTNSISSQVEEEIARTTSVYRVAGPDRYATSRAINLDSFPQTDAAILASGSSFPDALAGGAFGASLGRPLYLVKLDCVPDLTLDALAGSGVGTITLLGGPRTLAGGVELLVPCSQIS